MKTSTLLVACVVVLLLSFSATRVQALPRGYSNNGMNYIEGSSDLSRWSCGIYSDSRDRDVTIRGDDFRFDLVNVMGYVGYDIKPWMILYVTAGGADNTLRQPALPGEPDREDSSSAVDVGVGLKFNILDHEIMDPTLFEDKIRIDGGVQYSASSLDDPFRGTEDYSELSASLTLGVVNDIQGNTLFLPNSIEIFAGGIFSDFVAGDVDVGSKLGYTAGVDIFYTEKVTIEASVQGFDTVTVCGAIHLRL